MNNLKSYTEYAVTAPTTDFVIGFDFNYGTDAVNVTVDDVPASEGGYSVIYLNSTTMRLSPAVPTGVVRLQRETDIDVPDNQFTAGAKFTASNMDENFKQLCHAQQEVRDETTRTAEQFAILDANATAALNAANTAVTTANSIDTKATTALANSNTAIATANTALSTANSIDAKATTALSNSSTALTTATTALSTANGIDAKATQAQQDASAALSTVSTQRGAAGGIATLDADTKVPVVQLPEATTSSAGVVELATQAEVNAGTDDERVVTPDKLLAGVKNHLNAAGSTPIYACRAWVSFNGTGAVAIKGSGNVSSITDNGVGDYTVNFAVQMQDWNYAVTFGTSDGVSGSATPKVLTSSNAAAVPYVKNQFGVRVGHTSAADTYDFSVAVFR